MNRLAIMLRRFWWLPALAGIWYLTRKPSPTANQLAEFNSLNTSTGYGDANGAAKWAMRDDGIMLVTWQSNIGINPNSPVNFTRLVKPDGTLLDYLGNN